MQFEEENAAYFHKAYLLFPVFIKQLDFLVLGPFIVVK